MAATPTTVIERLTNAELRTARRCAALLAPLLVAMLAVGSVAVGRVVGGEVVFSQVGADIDGR